MRYSEKAVYYGELVSDAYYNPRLGDLYYYRGIVYENDDKLMLAKDEYKKAKKHGSKEAK